ncbi:hypothetical protein ACFQ1E_15785 [Sphingomonas canadensis]|uniref:Uncharacterized protein n=1 Tax=Sphingomonas canadensis TaxID=1219257 RepID=A0ABW3H8H7_9SPHN|nr:hypothetical protein [Sphingomonas canadensis]MCW3837342.1 hypothetical protein [Sphingomonas canadensis]
MAHLPNKPFTRWTRDTEAAFLLALKLTGQVRKAAAEIGRATTTAYAYRNRNADFAARWDAVVAEHQAEWLAARRPAEPPEERLRPGRDRRDGWNAQRRRAFLKTVAECGSVSEACRRTGISTTAAYRYRNQHARFAAEWDDALMQAATSIEHEAWRRAVEGVEEPVVAGGQIVGTRRRYSDTLLRALMARGELIMTAGRAGGGRPLTQREKVARAHAAAAEAGGAFFEKCRQEDTDAAILKKIEMVERARNRERGEEQAAEWLRWGRAWAAFGRAMDGGDGTAGAR